MNAPLFLSSRVFLAVADDSYVLLDLERDKYFSVDQQRAMTLERVVVGWPPRKETDGAIQTTTPGQPDASDISTLINQGLLTRDSASGRDANPVSIETPATAMIRRDLTSTVPVSLWDLLAFLHSSVRVVAMRRCSSIASIVDRVQRRKTLEAASPQDFDMAAAQRLLAVFDTLRPFFPGSYSCLPDSLLLLEFLAAHRIYPTWVFSVRLKPWRAHCWLQESDVVLNDAVERVRNFTPIMAI